MAALTHYSKVDATQRTTTSATAVEITQYTVAWADLTGAGFSAGDDVLLICQFSLGGSNAVSNIYTFEVSRGTSFAGRVVITDAHADLEPIGGGTEDYHNQFWMERHTLVVNENIYFSMQGTTGTTQVDDFSFIVLRLDELTEGVDFKWNSIEHGVGDAPTTYGTSGASVTIPAAGEDWLAFAQVRWLIDSASADAFTALQVDGVDRMELQSEGEHLSEDYLHGIVDALVSPASGATVRVRFRTDSAATHDAFTSKVFILRLGAFRNYDLARSTATVTHSALDTFQEFAGFGAFGLDVTGDVAFFAQSRHVLNEATKGPYGRLQVGGADVVSGYRRSTARGNGSSDKNSVTFAVVAAQTAGTLDIDFDIAEDFDVTPNYSANEHAAVVFSFERAGDALTRTILRLSSSSSLVDS